MTNHVFPKMISIRQNFPRPAALAVRATVRDEFGTSGVLKNLRPGARIAVAVGSRGITNLLAIVRAVLDQLKQAGASPFVMPAMGSHGGATPEGQRGVLAEYGLNEESLGVEIRPSMEVQSLGKTPEGIEVYCSVEAMQSDGVVVINRIKPHTDFAGPIGSGVIKMMVIGLGKRAGAAECHQFATRLGHERVIRSVAAHVLKHAPILAGVGLVEDQHHQTAAISVMRPDRIVSGEEKLFALAQELFPKLPFEDIDLLIIDRIGKNISGAGMDPNVIGRGVQGYYSSLVPLEKRSPFVRRIFVRDLTPETHGNAIGLGYADVTTTRCVEKIDKQSTYINALTSMTPQSAKVPIYFETDRAALERLMDSLALPSWAEARVVRIHDTLNLAHLEVSENLIKETKAQKQLATTGELHAPEFDASGNLTAMAH